MVAQARVATPAESALAYANCAECPLNGRVKVLGHGNPDAALAVVGEGPSAHDVVKRRPFAGPSGALLDATLLQAGLPRQEVYVTQAVLCRTTTSAGDDAPPPAAAVACCRPRLVAELNAVNPRLVLSLGAGAAKSLLRTRQTVTEIQGVVEYRDDLPAPVLPTWHPQAALNPNGGDAKFDDLLAAVHRAARIARGEMVLPDRNETIAWAHVTDPRKAGEVLQDLARGGAGYELAIDVETGGLDVLSDPLLQVAVGNPEKGVVFEADVFFGYAPLCRGNYDLMQAILNDPSFTWIIHNSSFDLQWLRELFRVTPPNVVDTMCLSLGVTERKGMASLKRLSREYLNAPYYEDEVHSYIGPGGTGWENVPRHILAKYAALDVVYTARMRPILDDLCREEGTYDLAYGLLMPAQRVFAEVERYGVLVDQEYLRTLETEWAPRVEQAAQAIRDYARAQGFRVYETKKERVVETRTETELRWRAVLKDGSAKWFKTKPKRYPHATVHAHEVQREFSVWVDRQVEVPMNPNSQPQLARFLFDHLKLKPPGGERTTGKAFREAYPNHPIVPLLEAYGLAEHMMSTYVLGIKDDIKVDGRVHPNIDMRAVTGRLAMHNPPLQTIPREGTVKEGFASIKRMFIPSPGHVWMESDYSQLEVRCAWHLSGDDTLGEAVMSGDFHRMMAAKIFKVPVEEVTPEQRQRAKVGVFATFYGATASGLAQQFGISVEEGQEFIDSMFAAAPRYRDWYFEQHRKALEEGRVTTPFGRVRRFNLITRQNRQSVLNQSVNSPVQSLASDLNLRAFVILHEEFKRRKLGHLLFPVHDSINAEVVAGREAEAAELVERVMTTWPFPSKAILAVEMKFGPSWGETKAWEK